ncbi:mechanosensitive ion channel [Synechocystis sp. PCC 7339]|uniref:mechanosensitive ion channel family protein n=1 Tax=unclassified Synechocystis TaxID=2640012 RepID=UPI001BB0527A|nr:MULTISPECIES: mechanosensitive ion channel domain-containing protein [unclassified Synechocystis]QUS59433.1 mechanosensitive ion channel [Synechocystis sp. PCC 7338]UAJ71618.1 mechanosensitive ion channel [Synechocystis sp. PCC 7339]
MEKLINIIQSWLSDPNVVKLIEVAIGILIVSIVFKMAAQGLSSQVQDGDLRYRIRKILAFISYGFIALLIVTIFNENLRQLTVIFGVVGAGIAFALQEVIASFAGWTAISFGEFYKTGDRVQLGGIMGDVIDINPLRTTLMECGDWVKADLYNGRIVRIANSFVFKEPVFNYSGDFPFIWDEIVVPVRHGGDHRLARNILQRVVEEVTGSYIEPAKAEWSRMIHKYLIEDAQIEPFVTLIANDNWLEFTVRYVVDYKKRRATKDRLFTQILEEIDGTNRRVELASTTVELISTPGLHVSLESGNGAN